MQALLFVILQKYDFSSKSQLVLRCVYIPKRCLWYCKSTIFQANHNHYNGVLSFDNVVCDTAKVRFFKQITTRLVRLRPCCCCLRYCKSTIFQANHNLEFWPVAKQMLFAILQKYDFSSKSQPFFQLIPNVGVVCDTAKVRFFKQITT